MTSELTAVQRLKLDILERGIVVSERARAALTQGGRRALTQADYPTTGGLTVRLPQDVYVNAAVAPNSSVTQAIILDVESGAADNISYSLQTSDSCVPAVPLPLPGYLRLDEARRSSVMTHADRVRISPIAGCSVNCTFCDSPRYPYEVRSSDHLLDALRLAIDDKVLVPRHVLISGGTPRYADRAHLDALYKRLIRASSLPVDVMLTPRESTDVIDRLVEWGAYGLAINLELFNTEMARRFAPYKRGLGIDAYARSIRRAVNLTGGAGRVRSLLLIGLEPVEDTLRGVRFLAELGCDPCLSPFRPAAGTKLEAHPLPEASLLEEVYLASREIADAHGVKLGPRCIPCQHNTVAFPDNSGAFYYS